MTFLSALDNTGDIEMGLQFPMSFTLPVLCNTETLAILICLRNTPVTKEILNMCDITGNKRRIDHMLYGYYLDAISVTTCIMFKLKKVHLLLLIRLQNLKIS